MRIARTAPPHVALRVARFGLDLRERLARALAGHRDLDPGCLGEFRDHDLTPFDLRAAVQREIALTARRRRRQDDGDGADREEHGPSETGLREHDLLRGEGIGTDAAAMIDAGRSHGKAEGPSTNRSSTSRKPSSSAVPQMGSARARTPSGASAMATPSPAA